MTFGGGLALYIGVTLLILAVSLTSYFHALEDSKVPHWDIGRRAEALNKRKWSARIALCAFIWPVALLPLLVLAGWAALREFREIARDLASMVRKLWKDAWS